MVNTPPPPPRTPTPPPAVAPGENFYFAFGGCHRWEAAKRLGLATIPAKVIRVAPAVINTYLGASSPFRRRQ
jgi:sulfiredoxin